MNNKTIINIFNSDNSNIAYIKTQNCQIFITIAYRILKFEPMIKTPILANYEFYVIATFSRNNSFAYLNSIALKVLIFKKIFFKIIYHSIAYNSIWTIVYIYQTRILYHLLAHLSHKIYYKLYHHVLLLLFLYIYIID